MFPTKESVPELTSEVLDVYTQSVLGKEKADKLTDKERSKYQTEILAIGAQKGATKLLPFEYLALVSFA